MQGEIESPSFLRNEGRGMVMRYQGLGLPTSRQQPFKSTPLYRARTSVASSD